MMYLMLNLYTNTISLLQRCQCFFFPRLYVLLGGLSLSSANNSAQLEADALRVSDRVVLVTVVTGRVPASSVSRIFFLDPSS